MASAIIGNASTKVYHAKTRNDSCRTEEIKRSNRRSFDSAKAAETAGYRACKRCIGPPQEDEINDVVQE